MFQLYTVLQNSSRCYCSHVTTWQGGKKREISLRKHSHFPIVYCVTAYRNIHGLCTELWTLVAHLAQYSFRMAKEVQTTMVSSINSGVNVVLFFPISEVLCKQFIYSPETLHQLRRSSISYNPYSTRN